MTTTRTWAMPSPSTWSIQPITDLLSRYISQHDIVVDPFSGGSKVGTVTNDIRPEIDADFHMDAIEWLDSLIHDGLEADVVLLDPPYSPRQIAECYQSVGRRVTASDTQNARLYAQSVERLDQILKLGGVAIRAGWNSTGFGKAYNRLETLLVCHGGAHNDTIITVDRKIQGRMSR